MSAARKFAVPVLAAGVFLLYFFLLEGVAIDYWDTYIAAPATFIAGKPCRFVDERGAPRFDAAPAGALPGDLVDPKTYGIASKDQRIGAGVTFAPAYLAFGMLGFRLLYALLGAMAFLMAVLVGRRLFTGDLLPAVLGLVVAVNPYMLSMNRLNANFIAVPIAMGFLALLLQQRPRWLVAGLVYGALGGIRNEMIVIAPVLALFVLARRKGWLGLPALAVGALAGIAPYLAWNRFAFGKAIIHASQFEAFDGWRPTFPHRFLGWRFELNGLFNWPFHDHLVRTPHYPFPTYLTLPLTFVLCFGVLLCAAAVLGVFAQWRKGRAPWAFLVGWVALVLALFLFQENWEEPKNTFGALAIPPLAVLMVRGIEWLASSPRSLRRWAALAAVVVLIEAGVLGARGVNVPRDERWYVRFPKATVEAPAIGCLKDEARREWMIFHTDECAAELAEQRAKLTRGNLLPRSYYPIRLHAPRLGADFRRFGPDIFDIWNRIYGF